MGMGVFWTILWRRHFTEDIPKYAGHNPQRDWNMIITSLLNHTMPGASAVVLMTINDCVLLMNRIRVIIGGCFIYVGFNWYSVMVVGREPSYHFMTYDSAESWATVTGICSSAVAFYYGICKFDQKLKNRQIKSGKKNC